MKAWVLHDINDIRLEDREVPKASRGEVLVEVRAAGVCGSDIPRIYENGAHVMPLVPGHEFAGVIAECGEDNDNSLIGKRVGIFPLIPCEECAPCRAGHPEMCRDYGYVGSRRDGAFAGYVTVPAGNIIEIPENVSFEEAAMLEPMSVAVHAMRLALSSFNGASLFDNMPEKNIVVCGLGTIGLLLTMFLLDKGFKHIYVIGNKDGQRKRALSIGLPADRYFDIREGDVLSRIREHIGGAALFFECVGRNESINYGIELAEPGGVIVLIGNPFSDACLPRDTYWKILRNQLTVRGTWNSTFLKGDKAENDDWRYVLKRLSSGNLSPKSLITHRLKMDGLEKGFHIMRDKTEDYCKVMLLCEER